MNSEGFVVQGVVEPGDQRGRTIGFPTANVAIEPSTAADGVWAGWVESRGHLYVAAISVGNRATFYGDEGFRLLEAHLLDFQGDLYDERVTVWMCTKLREQQRFDSVDHLIAQLRADVASTAAWAATVPSEPAASGASVDLPLGRLLVQPRS